MKYTFETLSALSDNWRMQASLRLLSIQIADLGKCNPYSNFQTEQIKLKQVNGTWDREKSFSKLLF